MIDANFLVWGVVVLNVLSIIFAVGILGLL